MDVREMKTLLEYGEILDKLKVSDHVVKRAQTGSSQRSNRMRKVCLRELDIHGPGRRCLPLSDYWTRFELIVRRCGGSEPTSNRRAEEEAVTRWSAGE